MNPPKMWLPKETTGSCCWQKWNLSRSRQSTSYCGHKSSHQCLWTPLIHGNGQPVKENFLADLTQNLRQLLSKHSMQHWGLEWEEAFTIVNRELTKPTVLALYEPEPQPQPQPKILQMHHCMGWEQSFCNTIGNLLHMHPIPWQGHLWICHSVLKVTIDSYCSIERKLLVAFCNVVGIHVSLMNCYVTRKQNLDMLRCSGYYMGMWKYSTYIWP